MNLNHQVKDSWNAKLYDHNHSFVSKYGSPLIELLAPTKGESILDLGCGTGDLANQIYEYGVNIIGMDQSQNMINQALKKYPHLSFNVEDVLEMEYQNQFDAVFSNATLHWIKKPKQALQGIFHSLKFGGRFVAEFGGLGNVQTITDEIIHQLKCEGMEYTSDQFPWYFPSIGEYAALMEEVGFYVPFAQHYDRPTPLDGENGLRNWIEMFAGNILVNQSEGTKERIMTNVEKNLRNTLYKDGQWVADYKRIVVVGMKK